MFKFKKIWLATMILILLWLIVFGIPHLFHWWTTTIVVISMGALGIGLIVWALIYSVLNIVID